VQLTKDQVAVVTGGASGIGFGLAEAFSRRGLNVVVADVRADGLDQARRSLESQGGQVRAVLTDVRDPVAVDDLAVATLDHFGRVDVICNNAGVVGPFGYMWEQDLAAWRWVLDVALMGVIHGIRSFVPHLIRNGSGHVVNTASVGGLTALPMLAPYNAAKHAVVGLSETLLAELRQADAGVGVTVLCPGLVDTDLAESSNQNRPADLPPRPTDFPADATRNRGRVGPTGPLAPSEVAEITLDAIERDQVHVVIPDEASAAARARIRLLLNDLAAETA
jgi:NAD(P)-dependent dehydrogenase (short-subunit alcohol dehydrogenase family)